MKKTIHPRPTKYLWPLILLGLGTLTGCQVPVGGPCTYEEQVGTALIESDDQGICGVFTPALSWYPETPVDWRGRPMNLTGLDHVRVGIHYPAHFKVIQKGSCIPVELKLLSDETQMLGFALPLDREERETEQTQQRIEQITATLLALTPDWPECKLCLYGPGARITQKHFQQCLTERGGDPERIQIVSDPLPDNLFHPFVVGDQEIIEVFFSLQP